MATFSDTHLPTPQRHVEVDAARLLLILNRFALLIDDHAKKLRGFPQRPTVRYFTPEYKLQKLDFLVRYPTYFAYELIELYRLEVLPASEQSNVMEIVRKILSDQEPDLKTSLYQRYLRGAYERLDIVEAWWYSRELVYRVLERKGHVSSAARPQKYYFLTEKGENTAKSLIEHVEHAQWYDSRISLVHQYFGKLSAADLKKLQYSHKPYREAQLNEEIPDLPLDELLDRFDDVFGEELGITISKLNYGDI